MTLRRPLPAGCMHVVAGFALVWAAAWAFGIRVNTSASLPTGLWLEKRVPPGALKRGVVITLCPSDTSAFRLARDRGYIGAGWCPHEYEPLLKPVVATAGDEVSLTAAGIDVNGVHLPNSVSLKYDSARRPMPGISFGKYTVLPGTVWVISSYNSGSFDSRYFGPVSISNIRSLAIPLWVRGQR